MRIDKVYLLTALAVIEAVIIVVLALGKYRIQIGSTITPVTAINSPLQLALEYESPDEKFEEIVKKNTEWIPYRQDLDGAMSMPILGECALLQRTNYVRILIENGAKSDIALSSLQEIGAEEAIRLLREVEADLSLKKENPSLKK